jgi:hypothetical protein
MLKKIIFMLSSFALSTPTLHAAAQAEPLITVVAWKPDSTKVAIGNAQGTLFVFDRATNSWTQKEHVEGRNCHFGCHKPFGIMQISWLENGNLKINEHIEFHLGIQEVIHKTTGPLPFCFRCTSGDTYKSFVYKTAFQDAESVSFVSPNQQLRLDLHPDQTEPGKFTFSLYELTACA